MHFICVHCQSEGRGNPKMLKEEQSMNLVGLFGHFNYVESTYIDVEHMLQLYGPSFFFVHEKKVTEPHAIAAAPFYPS